MQLVMTRPHHKPNRPSFSLQQNMVANIAKDEGVSLRWRWPAHPAKNKRHQAAHG
jgi:hypothetical protein